MGRNILIGAIGGAIVLGGIAVTDPLDRLHSHDLILVGGIAATDPADLHDHKEQPAAASVWAAPAPAVTDTTITIDEVRVELSRGQDGEWRGAI